MGLLGVFICHMLKKKGYRCTTESEQEEEELGEKIELNESTNDNGDTVGKIVDYIMKNEGMRCEAVVGFIVKCWIVLIAQLCPNRFRVTKVEHKSASKERKNLMSVSGVESVNGEVPATPVKEASKEAPVTPAVKQVPDERQCTRAKQEDRARSGSA
nr:RELT-like protein 1 [Zootoca vivipara]